MTNDDWFDGPPKVPVRGLTKRELADATAYTLTRLDKLCREGLPARRTASRRDGLRFDLPDVIEWLCEHRRGDAGDGTETSKQRLENANARLREIQAKKAEMLVVDVALVDQWIAEEYTTCRQRLLHIENECPSLNADQRQEVKDAIYRALDDLSSDAAAEDLGLRKEQDHEEQGGNAT